jgi:phenylacetate-CoA ligase
MTDVIATEESFAGLAQRQLADRLPGHIGRLDWTAEQIADHQLHQLRALVGHAITHAPLHARRLHGIDPSVLELSDLAQLPVLTKPEMLEHFDEAVTDPRLTRQAVERHLADSLDRPSLLFGEYVCWASGGSSGVRAVFVQTLNELVEFQASIRRRSEALAMAPGRPGEPVVNAWVAAASPIHGSAFLAAVFTNEANRSVSVPATLPIDEIVTRLNRLQPHALLAYTSVLVRLAAEQQEGRLRIAPRSVSAGGEHATDDDTAAITAAFGVPVVNLFASSEGLIGHTEPGGSVHVFASDMCIAELVDDDNQPVDEGTLSAKVLVTNLNNFTQPLIRYELTDRFVRQPPGADGHLRAIVGGRADDEFCYGRTVVHPHVVRSVMVRTPEVSEYQVRQTVDGIEVRAVTTAPIDTATLGSALATSLEHAGVDEPQVSVHIVAAIDRHAQTGKARRFIPLESSIPP